MPEMTREEMLALVQNVCRYQLDPEYESRCHTEDQLADAKVFLYDLAYAVEVLDRALYDTVENLGCESCAYHETPKCGASRAETAPCKDGLYQGAIQAAREAGRETDD